MRPGDYQTENQAQSYLNKRFSGGLRKVHLDEIAIINKWLNEIIQKENLKFLDIATGTGRAIPTLLNFKPRAIFALDQSEAMLNQLAKTYPKPVKSGLIKIISGNASKISLAPRSIDLAISLHLFKHIESPLPIFKSANQVLKPGGFFIFDALNIQSIVKFNLDSCFAYSETQLRSLLKKAGFKVIQVKYLHVFGETIYNFLNISPLDKMANNFFPKKSTKMLFLVQKDDQS